jgi:hypothetical protein
MRPCCARCSQAPRTDSDLEISDASDREQIVEQASADFTQGSHEALDGRDW